MTHYVEDWEALYGDSRKICQCWEYGSIRPSVDGLCRDGPSEISRDPRTKRLQTQPKRLGWP